MVYTGGRIGTGWSIVDHLSELQEGVRAWLEKSYYERSSPQQKRLMRANALTPADADRPEQYRLYLSCKDHNTLWWPGGVSDQPHVLMLEFSACRVAELEFQHYVKFVKELTGGL